ncbi:FAD-dependent oxidoreductase [Flavihumibacter rivuli]|uniref:ferredoxin--NADP reductase n=1 Tax=Flavihumibacter rivuli TaxID=2838156 RepID=UPI001BDE1C8A|nr:FAD-dependent oxidoreductase [Flavihumibacter rivuli]ULQ54985.1 FAD-dependent oxidoreductase [Flavihumibacter rivuli]
MLQPWLTGKVIRILDETATTRRFWIEVQGVDRFDFKPGQFVTLDLPIHEQRNKRWRSYSIASWPDGTNVIELVIVLMEGGLGTSYLFNEVKEGSELQLRGPQGVFVLPENIEKDLFFVCTGTGIAPFRSMAHHILNNNIPHKNIYLIFGCRKFGDCLYGPELKALQEKVPSFQYLPTFSREEAGDHLIRTGYVHAVYEEIITEKKKENGALHPANFYLCGWKNMIDEAKQRIIAIGYDKKDIHLELYG